MASPLPLGLERFLLAGGPPGLLPMLLIRECRAIFRLNARADRIGLPVQNTRRDTTRLDSTPPSGLHDLDQIAPLVLRRYADGPRLSRCSVGPAAPLTAISAAGAAMPACGDRASWFKCRRGRDEHQKSVPHQ